MPRSARITKELVLEHALRMLVRDGYASVNIKALAQDIGCSTQPLSWHFGTMENLRKELAVYALAYADGKMRPASDSAFEAFTEVGAAYLDIAFDEPLLFRFLYLDGSGGYCVGGPESLAGSAENAELSRGIAAELGISEEQAALYLRNAIVFAHGVASLAASGVMDVTRQQARDMVDEAGYAFLAQAGADVSAARGRANRLAEGGDPC